VRGQKWQQHQEINNLVVSDYSVLAAISPIIEAFPFPGNENTGIFAQKVKTNDLNNGT
jgi:hypothetical protein